MTTVSIAKKAMKLFERRPDLSSDDAFLLQEIFNHEMFLEGTGEERREIMLQSSRRKYQDELDYPWDQYFGFNLKH